MKKKLKFYCPYCERDYYIQGYWRWLFSAPFHVFDFITWQDFRWTKCPYCGKRSLTTWNTIFK